MPDLTHRGRAIYRPMETATLTGYHKVRYLSLLPSSKLNSYLTNIDWQAQERLEHLVQQMVQIHGNTKGLRTTDQLAWVGKMYTIRVNATEIVNQVYINK